ncbi:DoxX family protein [Aquimarina aquimarini]|uniref:DoxX family protein n=1 Tax=Aquimarina aquimarini TaxID=1191734 RepID=UPI000D55E0ED|nr:DoxX family protein [Aquimarina aquimarini]
MNIYRFLYSSDTSWAGFVARVFAGIVLFPHGAQKLLGMFDGAGASETIKFFVEVMNLPWLLAWLVIIIEFFGALALILGFFARIWAILITVLFLGIIITVQGEHGFFMNWMGNQQGEGVEYSLLLIGLCVVVMITDGGKYRILKLIK